jgi:hypothetical protein
VKRKVMLLLCILLLAVLTLACVDTGGDGTSTPVPPAGRSGNEAINAQRAEGLRPDCSKYAVWEVCP